jgi:flagellar hook-length control protein FliK
MLSIVETSVAAQPAKAPKAIQQSDNTSSEREQFASHLDKGNDDTSDTPSAYGLAQGEETQPTPAKDKSASELTLTANAAAPSDAPPLPTGDAEIATATPKLSNVPTETQAMTAKTDAAADSAAETTPAPETTVAKTDMGKNADIETTKVQTQPTQAIEGEATNRPSGGQTQDDTPQKQAASVETAAKSVDTPVDADVKTNTPLPTLSAALDAKALAGQGNDVSATNISTDFTASTATQTSASSTQAPSIPLRAAPLSTPAMIAPADIPNIMTQTLSSPDKQTERVIVQLDPPELGRVSIDFKFDGGTLQAVTITGETPEALRQLRTMHFELINSLEQQGLSGSDLTFSHQQFSDQTEQAAPFSAFDEPEGEYSNVSLEAIQTGRQQLSNANGLDIKL